MADDNKLYKHVRDENWDGYTLDELRYRRAFVAARLEIDKERLLRSFNHYKEGTLGSVASIFSRLGSYFPFISSAIISLSVANKFWGLFKQTKSLFSKKK